MIFIAAPLGMSIESLAAQSPPTSPFNCPVKFYMALNLKTAKALGLTVRDPFCASRRGHRMRRQNLPRWDWERGEFGRWWRGGAESNLARHRNIDLTSADDRYDLSQVAILRARLANWDGSMVRMSDRSPITGMIVDQIRTFARELGPRSRCNF